MKGFGPFLMGAIVGGGAVFASLSYHFVRTKDGVEAVPKLSPTFTETYVDAREFGPADWERRKTLTAAILKANRGKIIGDGVIDKAQEAIQQVLPQGFVAPEISRREVAPPR